MHPLFSAGAAALILAQSPAAPEEPHYEKARTLVRQLLAGDDAVEPQLSREFLDALGGREGISKFARQIAAEAGTEEEVLREAIFREAGHINYYRRSRFARVPDVTIHLVIDPSGRVLGGWVLPTQAPAANPHEDYRTRAHLRLPFRSPAREGHWYVGWGGREAIDNYHVVAADQRYAYDFFVTRHDGSSAAGKGDRNEDHFCWGEPVVSPAAGRVIASIDGVEDNEQPGSERADVHPAGNHVVIDHGRGEYSLLAHFRRGTVAVRAGQQVRAGDLLGQCGNSGRSSMPHVHYHLQTTPTFGEGFGLPAFFNDYLANGGTVRTGEPVRGEAILPLQGD
jgi:hypothetical protein